MRIFPCVTLLATTLTLCLAGDPRWTLLSSSRGQLPVPGASTQQTALVVGRFDASAADGFIVGARAQAPALVWYRPQSGAWTRYVIEDRMLPIEAGGAVYDIDGDGDPDIVFGADASGNELWWWENPYPNFDPKVPWKRHLIRAGGAPQFHDQIFADIKGTGKPQLIFWNQQAKQLLIAEVPADPRASGPWPAEVIFSGKAGDETLDAAQYAEGLDAFDVDGDGHLDLLAGNCWFKLEAGRFRPIRVGAMGGRIRAGRFKPGPSAQIVIAPGDGTGPLMIYEAAGDPAQSASWHGRKLLDQNLVHGHTLDLGDVDGDGNLDIFVAEMATWLPGASPDYPGAQAWILYGDGRGGFRTSTIAKGQGWHEGKLADVNGDGRLDIVNKPYTWNAPRIDIWKNDGPAPGLELWTFRRELEKDLPATLARIHQLGITDVETSSTYGLTPAAFRKQLELAGLTCGSYIAGYHDLKTSLDGVIATAHALGARYVVTSDIPHQGALQSAHVRQAAADFNRWAQALHSAGLRFGYHAHGFEFTPQGAARTLFDDLLAQTDPELVTFEMDIFWFAHGGADPVRYLTQHPRRFALLHLKDMAKGTPVGLSTGRAPDETSVALGAGQLDIAAILCAARRAGVDLYYIEDESSTAERQVVATLEYLKHPHF